MALFEKMDIPNKLGDIRGVVTAYRWICCTNRSNHFADSPGYSWYGNQ